MRHHTRLLPGSLRAPASPHPTPLHPRHPGRGSSRGRGCRAPGDTDPHPPPRAGLAHRCGWGPRPEGPNPSSQPPQAEHRFIPVAVKVTLLQLGGVRVLVRMWLELEVQFRGSRSSQTRAVQCRCLKRTFPRGRESLGGPGTVLMAASISVAGTGLFRFSASSCFTLRRLHASTNGSISYRSSNLLACHCSKCS